MDLLPYLEDKRKKVDTFLESRLKTDEPHFQKLFEAMRYSLLAGGKRVRPILVIAAYEACVADSDKSSEREDTVMRVASALEMIHTYSLIHDDLPAMDNDDLRRGRPTNHKKYGEAIAILAGDSLLTEAFLTVARGQGISPDILLEVITDIAEASGGQGMAGGQALDLEAEHRKISAQELENLHRHKTGCLIRVAVTSGAKLAAASGAKLAAMKSYGEAIGLAFQIADDILDVEGGAEEMGKATGGDQRKEKATYPSILGLESSKKLASDLVKQAIESLAPLGDARADALKEIALYIVARRY